MFKRLFFLSGIIAFVLASALMYFWYLPNHPTKNETTTEVQVEKDSISTEVDSLNTIAPVE